MSYDYDKLQFFRVRPSDTPTGHVAIAPAEAFIDGPHMSAAVILALDLGILDDALSGIRFPFLELAVFQTRVDLKLGEDGRFILLGSPKHGPEAFGPANDAELEDSIAETREDIEEEHGIALGASVRLEGPVSEGDARPFSYCRGEDIYWCQSHGAASYGVDGPQWLYVGCVQFDFYFGTVYGFYNKEAGIARLVFECT